MNAKMIIGICLVVFIIWLRNLFPCTGITDHVLLSSSLSSG